MAIRDGDVKAVDDEDGVGNVCLLTGIAAGSASEAEYQLLLAHDLGYLKQEDYQVASTQVQEVKRMLSGLRKKLTADS